MTVTPSHYPWKNLVEMFLMQAEKQGNRPFLWGKENGVYQSISWQEAKTQVLNLARALQNRGINAGDRIVLVSENSPQWAIADFAIMASGAITVPAYITNTVHDHQHILENSGAKAAIVSSKKLALPLLKAMQSAQDIDFCITMKDPGLTQELSTPLYKWDDLVSETPDALAPVLETAQRLQLNDTACLIYTSGTGGAPKGVETPHRAILHNCMGAKNVLEALNLETETFLSFLPLSHSYEHSAGLMFPTAIGAQIYYAERADTLMTNLGESHPTIMVAVPRLYEVIRDKILRGLKSQSPTKQKLFHKTVELGMKKAKGEKLGLCEKLINAALTLLVRKKVKQRFGGRLKAFVSGGGPLNPEVGYFFQALGLRILQGYGQTESGPVCAVNRAELVKMHTVGPALAHTEIKIADDGEILLRGDLLMTGYWRNPKATAETIIDGWLHTGDIGVLDEDGYLQITDRKKDIIVNSGGDNIAPQRIEGLLCLEPEISQAMVYGDNHAHLVGLIVPDEEFVQGLGKTQGLEGTYQDLIGDENVKKAVAHAVTRVNKDLSNIEKVRKFIVADEPFAIENKQMTPTMKIRRHIIKQEYGARLEKLYG